MGLDGGSIPSRTDLLRRASWRLASMDNRFLSLTTVQPCANLVLISNLFQQIYERWHAATAKRYRTYSCAENTTLEVSCSFSSVHALVLCAFVSFFFFNSLTTSIELCGPFVQLV